ncbi:CzcE family metal-binding protein [Duganella aceris]|uniref:CzcE family metal-binding protein n=1 Tax=Duganella aceris TaxID=2703883 RepID=A0ABX0FV24_9BURK|nr:CzcE family metal-binding protein [Duganella aceris]NGZ88144.1 CzcE family metal-binding protein [Duganella aceris]
MLNFKRATIMFAFACASATALIAPAGAVGITGTAADFGVQVNNDAAMRTVTISSDTKGVNVTNGETVRFNVDGQSFTWHFDTIRNETSFDLAKIAPAGVNAGTVRAYVASNPLYRG